MITNFNSHVRVTLLRALCLLLSSPIWGAVFAKYDGIDGEATGSQHRGW